MSIDGEALVVTSLILRFVGLANKSLGGAHRIGLRGRLHRGECSFVYGSIWRVL